MLIVWPKTPYVMMPRGPNSRMYDGRDDERRREERQDADEPEERLPAHVGVDHRVREDEAEKHGGRRRERGDLERVLSGGSRCRWRGTPT